MIPNIIYQLSYIGYKVSNIGYKISDILILISYILYKISDIIYDKCLNGLLKRLPRKQFFYLFSKLDI